MRRYALLVLVIILFAVKPAFPAAPVLSIDSGMIEGTERDGILIYKGIPYAAPPVGERRWMPPRPVNAWEGVRKCTSFGPRALQPRAVLGQEFGRPMSEDCLYLNVWAPSEASGDLPVMVWIHGGGFLTGSGSNPAYDGSVLARKGAVIVTINYRLGPFGFMAHPLLSKESPHHVSGNYGILDQIAALQWVKRNIARFGGNPGSVTIFGESAGASSVTVLMISPPAGGLFHRAVAESGFAMGLPFLGKPGERRRSAETEGRDFMQKMGCTGDRCSLEAMRNLPAEDILKASDGAAHFLSKGVKYRPVIDGYVIPADPVKLFGEGRQADVPFIAGANADEGTIFLKDIPVRHRRGYEMTVKSIFRERAAQVLSLYPVRSDGDVFQALNHVVTDSAFIAPARFAVKSMSGMKSKAFMYHFTRIAGTLKGRNLGAFHSLEIPYVFGSEKNFFVRHRMDGTLSQVMSSCWINFARTGEPGMAGTVQWPPYSESDGSYIEFGDAVKVKKGLRTRQCDFFEKIMRDGGRR